MSLTRHGRRDLVAGDDERPPAELLAAVDQQREVDPDLGVEHRPGPSTARSRRRRTSAARRGRVARRARGLDVEVQRVGLADGERVLADLLAADGVDGRRVASCRRRRSSRHGGGSYGCGPLARALGRAPRWRARRARWRPSARSTDSPSSERRPHQRQHRLGELDLADPRDAAAREARVPGEEPEEHRDDRDVGEAEPGGRAGVQAGRRRRARAATGACTGARGTSAQQIVCAPPSVRDERAALGVAERAQRDGDEQVEVGGRDRAAPPCAATKASTATRPAAAASQNRGDGRSPARSDRGHRGRGGQQRDDDRAVRGGLRSRSASEVKSGKPTTTPSGDDRERAATARAVGRGARGRPAGTTAASDAGDRRAAEGDEPRVEVGDREARRRQREARSRGRRARRGPRRGRSGERRAAAPGRSRYRRAVR